MSFSSNVQQAYKRKWSFINNFTCMITPVGAALATASSALAISWRDQELNIKDVTIPQYGFNPIEQWMTDQYRYAPGQPQAQTISITFRDQNQMELYRSFVRLFHISRSAYPEDCAISIAIYKDADYIGETAKQLVYSAKKAIISGVSQVQFSNETEAQIVEFSVDFYVYDYTIA